MTQFVKGHGFSVFDNAEYTGAICIKGGSDYSRKNIDELTDWIKRPQIGAKGLIYLKYNIDKTYKSSADKFFSEQNFKSWIETANAEPGDMLIILSGKKQQTLNALGELRLEMAKGRLLIRMYSGL